LAPIAHEAALPIEQVAGQMDLAASAHRQNGISASAAPASHRLPPAG
jgi:hypothetical protein